MNWTLQIIMVVTLNTSMTYILFYYLNGKRVNGSLFQQIADHCHQQNLHWCCFKNHENTTNCLIPDDEYDQIAGEIYDYLMYITTALLCCYGFKTLHYIILALLTIGNVWLLTGLYDDIDLSYQIDIFTVYFLVWQVTYLIYHWCSHQLSWPGLIFYKGSMCLLPAIVAYIVQNSVLPVPLYAPLFFWVIAFADVYSCFHQNGRFHAMNQEIFERIEESKCITFPHFCYYSHDIEDELDANIEFSVLGGGDLIQYNWLLLWLLPPSVSFTTHMYILLGFIVCILLSLALTCQFGDELEEMVVPGTPIPLIIISIYSIVIDFLIQNSDMDCVKNI